MRASSLAILVGRDWSDWLEELDEKCMSMSSDIATGCAETQTLIIFRSLQVVNPRINQCVECSVIFLWKQF